MRDMTMMQTTIRTITTPKKTIQPILALFCSALLNGILVVKNRNVLGRMAFRRSAQAAFFLDRGIAIVMDELAGENQHPTDREGVDENVERTDEEKRSEKIGV
jgi:hypothetical protein